MRVSARMHLAGALLLAGAFFLLGCGGPGVFMGVIFMQVRRPPDALPQLYSL